MSERLTEHNETGYVLKLDNPQNEVEEKEQHNKKCMLAIIKLGQLEESFTEEDVNGLIEDRDKTIKFLQQELAEKDKELSKYKSYKTDDEIIKDLTNLYSQYKEENNQLRKELKDKNFEIECKERDIKAIERQRDKAYDDYGYLDKISRELGLQNVDYEKQIALLKSSEKCLLERIKNQTKHAIQELEKVNGILTDTIIEVTQNEMDLNKLCYLEEISARFYEKMQEQIKELKGGDEYGGRYS